MTPSEKAYSLVEKYMQVTRTIRRAKACAIIVCDEIINTIYKDEFWADYDVSKEFLDERNYWKSVKEQISKL